MVVETQIDQNEEQEEELSFQAPKRESADELLDAHAGNPLDPMRHSAAHVMAEAVLDLFPGTKLGIGPAIADGFYYDFDLPRALTTDDLAAIEKRMAESVAADHPFVRKVLPPEEGKRFFAEHGQPYKVEILEDLEKAAAAKGEPAPEVSTYEHGPFIDLCRGPHVESTGKIGPFKLLAVSGAYWRGDQKRPALQRVYGTVWETQEELDRFLWRREEAKKRDHRRLGVQLDLFSFHDVAPGEAFWHPKGWTLYQTLRDAMTSIQAKRGYQEIYTPPLVHRKLWEQSGHWDLYRESMFLVEADDQTYSLKPMNCPEVDVHLSLARAVVPRVPVATVGVRRPASLRAVGRPLRPDACPALLHGRRAHLRHAGPDPGRDPGPDGRGHGVLLVVRARAAAHVRHAAGEGVGRRSRHGAKRRR